MYHSKQSKSTDKVFGSIQNQLSIDINYCYYVIIIHIYYYIILLHNIPYYAILILILQNVVVELCQYHDSISLDKLLFQKSIFSFMFKCTFGYSFKFTIKPLTIQRHLFIVQVGMYILQVVIQVYLFILFIFLENSLIK